MRFTFAHNNLNVFDLPKSLAFYRDALGSRRRGASTRPTRASSSCSWATAPRSTGWS